MNAINAKTAQSVSVYRADQFRVSDGFNFGDAVTFAEELELDSTYTLDAHAKPQRLSFHTDDTPSYQIATDTELGYPSNELHLDCCLTLISLNGKTLEVIVLVEVDKRGDIQDIYILPLAGLQPKMTYTLLDIDTKNIDAKLAEISCAAFTRGTQIVMVDGTQKRVEDLVAGDMILTRGSGPQELRWIGKKTIRAVGDYAPILIRAGALNNQNDLVVSPEHRLFIYQRRDEIGAGRSELMVPARQLVDGNLITQQEGGFVDYYHLLFDEHQIIFAEGIAAETLLIRPQTRPALPKEILERIKSPDPNIRKRALRDLDVDEALIKRPDAIDLLKNSSKR